MYELRGIVRGSEGINPIESGVVQFVESCTKVVILTG